MENSLFSRLQNGENFPHLASASSTSAKYLILSTLVFTDNTLEITSNILFHRHLHIATSRCDIGDRASINTCK